eukprot:GILK01002276.1.p1 GENE.GILK01002276.1~~GILK01002276.1.p1  ORF type:complete len:366 (+),score=4.74 GILK01002276.1:163-1098(+)
MATISNELCLHVDPGFLRASVKVLVFTEPRPMVVIQKCDLWSSKLYFYNFRGSLMYDVSFPLDSNSLFSTCQGLCCVFNGWISLRDPSESFLLVKATKHLPLDAEDRLIICGRHDPVVVCLKEVNSHEDIHTALHITQQKEQGFIAFDAIVPFPICTIATTACRQYLVLLQDPFSVHVLDILQSQLLTSYSITPLARSHIPEIHCMAFHYDTTTHTSSIILSESGTSGISSTIFVRHDLSRTCDKPVPLPYLTASAQFLDHCSAFDGVHIRKHRSRWERLQYIFLIRQNSTVPNVIRDVSSDLFRAICDYI